MTDEPITTVSINDRNSVVVTIETAAGTKESFSFTLKEAYQLRSQLSAILAMTEHGPG